MKIHSSFQASDVRKGGLGDGCLFIITVAMMSHDFDFLFSFIFVIILGSRYLSMEFDGK